jgi:hypothetical protein
VAAKEHAVLKKVIAGVATTAVLAVGGVAVAGAVSNPTTKTTTKPTTTPPKHKELRVANALVGLAMQTAAQTVGVDLKTLRTDVKSGHTIAAVATQHHVAPATVVHAIVTRLDGAIDKAVSSHRASAAQAAKLKQRVPTLANRLVNDTGALAGHGRRGRTQRGHGTATLNAAASAIGINVTTLRQQMHAGQTIAAIARAHGVAPSKVVDAMVAAADSAYRSRIAKAMENLVNGTTRAHRGARAKSAHPVPSS